MQCHTPVVLRSPHSTHATTRSERLRSKVATLAFIFYYHFLHGSMASRMASPLSGTVSLQLQPLYTHTLPPECSLPCQKSGHRPQTCRAKCSTVQASLVLALHLPCSSLSPDANKNFTSSFRARDALRTASPRFGEILNLTGYLINLSLPKMP